MLLRFLHLQTFPKIIRVEGRLSKYNNDLDNELKDFYFYQRLAKSRKGSTSLCWLGEEVL